MDDYVMADTEYYSRLFPSVVLLSMREYFTHHRSKSIQGPNSIHMK